INIENQYFEYRLTIYNVTFEDETDLNVTISSSKLKKTGIIKPNIIGYPIGQLSFISEQTPFSISWRNENKLNIYSYGIFQNESYRIVCTIRHRSDIKGPLNIFIQYSKCLIDNCLSNLIYETCQISSNKNLISTISNHINNYQTQFISSNFHLLNNPSIGHNYLCCYEQNGLISIAKATTVLSYNRNMFHINRPESSLVTGNVVTYRCEGHELIYNDLRMIYHDGLLTYERNQFDHEWHLKGTNQIKQVDIDWNATMKYEYIRSTTIEIKTSPLGINDNNKYIQCIGLSKQPNFISNIHDTYIIDVDDSIPLKFKNNLQTVSKLDRKPGDNVEFDCKFNGRPKPKILWLKGNLPLVNHDWTLQFGDNNESISITRVQASDTGVYTCKLNDDHDLQLERSFNLRIESTNSYAKLSYLVIIFIVISILILLLILILLIILSIKYFQMKQKVNGSIFYEQQPIGSVDPSQPVISQLTRISLPDNFASTQQIRTFLSYVNGDHLPLAKDDFKELGRGQFGVVYQVRLPEVGLVAAKILSETIRRTKPRRKKRKKIHYFEENEQMISQHEIRKKKVVVMLIDEIKLMHKAGKHVNIVALKKVAYPETKLKFLFIGEPIRDEDSFYLMELCSNGSLESMLKYFLQSSLNSTCKKLSLYETLSKQTKPGMTIQQAYEQCILTDDDLKLVAYQVACGIDYLNRRQIIHCNIAPRNVLMNSRFIMKICDLGSLATWTIYKNYREQPAQNESEQLEKKNIEIATHNLTPELAKAFIRVLNPDERLILNKSSTKSDVWSFGIFLWTLFLKCRIRPFNNLMEEIRNRSSGENFFHQLACIISEGHVLQYIDYQPEIPRNIYAIIRECLVEENRRPEMTRIRALFCHSKMLSKQAFAYYRLEYNRYQEENAIDGHGECFDEDQGTDDLSSFDVDDVTDSINTSQNPYPNNDTTFHSTAKDDAYQSTIDDSQQARDSYFTSTHNNQQIDADTNNSERMTNKSKFPQVHLNIWHHQEQHQFHRHL
ncbi:unnamed protein product, partial [Rotaria sp. Silwood2]